jgi:hypothetical protein
MIHPFSAGAKLRLFSGILLAAALLTGCDSTPRERQEVARKELRKLDTLARTGGRKLTQLGKATAKYDAANRLRRAQPLDRKEQARMAANLLGPTAGHVAALTPATIAGAYANLIRATRTRRPTWTDRDWDYARAVYKDLNDQLRKIRLDLPAREEVRVRARQAEFVALQAGHTAQGISETNKKQGK